MSKTVYYVEFESKYWHGAPDQYTFVEAESADEARFLAEPAIEKRLAELGYENDPGHITRVACLAQ